MVKKKYGLINLMQSHREKKNETNRIYYLNNR